MRFRFIRRLFLLALPALLLPDSLLTGQQTYYVSPDGSNSNLGTSPGSAWRTLQFASDTVAAGDSVIALPGAYQGFHLQTSGTAASPITFSGQPGALIQQVNPVTNQDGINLENVSHVLIEGFQLNSPTSNTRAGIRVVGDGFSTEDFSNSVTLRNNVATGWGKWGIFSGFANDLIIEGNQLSGSIEQHGIYVSNSGDRPVIRGNRVFNNHANGIHINGDINTGNTNFSSVDGIISDALVSGNIIFGNGVGGGSGINADGAVNATIENNLLYDNHASGISLFQIDGGAASTGGEIVNNTIINADDARWAINLRNGATNATLFNNIIFNLNESSFRGGIAALEGSEIGLTSDFNILDTRFSLIDGTSAIQLSQWQSSTGNDLNSIAIEEPGMIALFENYFDDNFELAADSSALRFGVPQLAGTLGNVEAPLFDLLDRLRQGGFDAGAFQTSSAIPEPTGLIVGVWLLLSLTIRTRRVPLPNYNEAYRN